MNTFYLADKESNRKHSKKFLYYYDPEWLHIYYCDYVIHSGSSNIAMFSSYNISSRHEFGKGDKVQLDFNYLQNFCDTLHDKKNMMDCAIRINLYPEDVKHIMEENLAHRHLYEATIKKYGYSSICQPIQILTNKNSVACIMQYYTPLATFVQNLINKNVYAYDNQITVLFNLYKEKVIRYKNETYFEDILRRDPEIIDGKKVLTFCEGEVSNFENEIKLMMNDLKKIKELDGYLSETNIRGFVESHRLNYIYQLNRRLFPSFLPKLKKFFELLIKKIHYELTCLERDFGFCHGDLTFNNILCDVKEGKLNVYFIDFGFSKFTIDTKTYENKEFVFVGEDKKYLTNNDIKFFMIHTYINFIYFITNKEYLDEIRDAFYDIMNRYVNQERVATYNAEDKARTLKVLKQDYMDEKNYCVRRRKEEMYKRYVQGYKPKNLKEILSIYTQDLKKLKRSTNIAAVELFYPATREKFNEIIERISFNGNKSICLRQNIKLYLTIPTTM